MDDVTRRMPVTSEDGHGDLAGLWPLAVLSIMAWALIFAAVGVWRGWW